MSLFKTRDQLIRERLREIEEAKRADEAMRRPVEDRFRHAEAPTPSDHFATGAALELLRDMKGKMDALTLKLAALESKFDERVPGKTLSEEAFMQEVVDSSSLAQEIIDGVKEELTTAANAHPIVASKDQMTIVEQKRIEKVLSILQEHGKLSSPQLATIMNMSRTRCNEYFRQMEELGLVEGVEVGKEKFYKPCN